MRLRKRAKCTFLIYLAEKSMNILQTTFLTLYSGYRSICWHRTWA